MIREDDPYLMRGDGRYVDDVTAASQIYAYVLRSPLVHAGTDYLQMPAIPQKLRQATS